MQQLLRRGYGREEVIGILRFIDGVIRLSVEGERMVYETLHCDC